jgi:hypothetical protein
MAEYGLYPVLLLAGFLGSLVFIAAQDGPPSSWWPIFSPVVAGTVTANYMAHFVVGSLPQSILSLLGDAAGAGAPAGIGAFVVGAGGPYVARGLARWAKSRNFNGNNVKDKP